MCEDLDQHVLSVFAGCCLDRQSREDSGFDFRISAYSLILNFVMQQGVSELRFKKKKKKKKKYKLWSKANIV